MFQEEEKEEAEKKEKEEVLRPVFCDKKQESECLSL